MAGLAHLLRGLLIPLGIALTLYLTTTLLLLPFIRRHRTRYTSYLPLTSSLTTSASTWRTTLSDALYTLFMPSTWRRQPSLHFHSSSSSASSDFDDEEGEGMIGFDPVDERRREALETRRSLVEEERRVGRELEGGFRDESEDEEGEGDDLARRSLSRARG